MTVLANKARSAADDWVEVGYDLFGEGGPAAVRIEVAAERLGVSRAGFYHRFENRAALLRAINERWLADGMDAYIRAGALASPIERLRGIGYFGLGNERLRRADQWLLVRSVGEAGVSEFIENIRGRATSWLVPHFVDLGLAPAVAERRAFIYFVAYLGLGAELESRPDPIDDQDLRDLVDDVVDLVVAPAHSTMA